MRTSSDIDILIRDEDYEKAKKFLTEECGFLYESKDKKMQISTEMNMCIWSCI